MSRPAVNVESLEQIKRELSDTVSLVRKLRETGLPHDWSSALSDAWLVKGELGAEFQDLIQHVNNHDLKKWHTQCVRAEDAITVIRAIKQSAIDHFGNSEINKLGAILSAPFLQVEEILEHEGLLVEIMVRIEEILVKALVDLGERVNLDVTSAGEEFARKWPNSDVGFGAQIEDSFGKLADAFGDSFLDVIDDLKHALTEALKPLMERMLYELFFEVIIAFVSAEAIKRTYAPVFKTRDAAQEWILGKILSQDNTGANAKLGKAAKKRQAIGTRPPKNLVAAINRLGKAAKHLKQDLEAAVTKAADKGDKRWRRRKRSARGSSHLLDFITPDGRTKYGRIRSKLKQIKKKVEYAKRQKAKAVRIKKRFDKLMEVKRKLHDGTFSDVAMDELRKQEQKLKAAGKAVVKAKMKRTMKDARELARGEGKKALNKARDKAADKLRERAKNRFYPDRPIGSYLR